MRVCIDAVPLELRSAGIKNYLYYWTTHLREQAAEDAIVLFPPFGNPGSLDHEKSVFGPLATLKDEQFRKIFENNVLSNHWLIQMVIPEMIARREGAVVIVSSIGGLRGSPLIGAYNVSKAADFQLARNLAVELGPHNVRVNCVAPGVIRTDFARALWDNPRIAKATEAGMPLRRIGEPDDVAGAIVFLSSPAGRYITGQKIVVDGGTLIATAALAEN